jgi:hypothetical protein
MPDPQQYRFVQAGGGVEMLDRFAVRDRIRSGDIDAQTELALAGGDDWKPASSFPELTRYFALASIGTARVSGSFAVPAKPRVVETMQQRIVGGLAYPLQGTEAITIAVLAAFGMLPLIGWFSTLASTLIMLAIIRKSADGSTKFPPLVDTSDIFNLLRQYASVLFVTIIALAPSLILAGWAIGGVFRRHGGMGTAPLAVAAAAAIGAIYYPACLATVAIWDHPLAALNPIYVARVIGRIGSDYFIVIAVWFIASAGTALTGILMPALAMFIPFVPGFIRSFLSLYVLFYASHLLGYAVYRHAPELGWE